MCLPRRHPQLILWTNGVPHLRWTPSELDPSRTPVHEPQADEPRVAEPSSHETRARVSHVTPETSGHADGEETWSDDSFSEGELVEQGKKFYERGGTKLLAMPATHDRRWLIEPYREK